MLKKLTKTQPDWHKTFNANADITEDKLTLKALCTYDADGNAYTLELLNVPATDGTGEPYVYPDCLPDLFSVVAKFPNDYADGAAIRIGEVDFTPKYAAFASGDIQQVNFDKVNKNCFFTSSGSKTVDAAAVDYENSRYPLLNNAEKTLDELLTISAIHNRIYEGVDLTVKFMLEIAAAPYSGDPWAWIKARIQAGNFAGVNIGDYIPFTAGGNIIKAEVAGIDTYYNYGDTAVGHHIDFISRDCWPDLHVFNKANYNNGTSVSPYPWLASDLYAYLNSLSMSVPNATTANPALVAVNYSTTGVYDKLPAALKNVIIPKRLYLPQRYTAGSLLTADNSWGAVDAGKLWIPSEIEVYGCEHWGSKNGFSGGSFQQYPIFAQNMKRIKGAGDGGARTGWWLISAHGGNSTTFAYVYGSGIASSHVASYTSIRAPLCFRIA